MAFGYTAFWIVACVAAAGLVASGTVQTELTSGRYWAFQARPWKLSFFALAWAALVFLAPFTGDPTWDAVDGTFMAVLTWATAPWAVGTLYKALFAKERPAAAAFVAACAWLFSASWSYDAYLWWRDGHYPGTWLTNLFASSGLYLGAGLLWNLTWRPEQGVIFAFKEPAWPNPDLEPDFGRVARFALLIATPVAISLLLFLVWNAKALFGWSV